jgi:hypothetical protein
MRDGTMKSRAPSGVDFKRIGVSISVKTVAVHKLPNAADDLRAGADVVLKLRPAKVEVCGISGASIRPQDFPSPRPQLKRRHFCVVQDEKLRHFDLDIARRELDVVRAFRSAYNRTFNGDHEFAAIDFAFACASPAVSSLTTTCVMPSRSRRSINVKTPKSRFFATQPISTPARQRPIRAAHRMNACAQDFLKYPT